MDRAGNRTTREIDLGDPTVPLAMPNKASLDRGKPDPALFPTRRQDRVRSFRPRPPERNATSIELPRAPKAEPPDSRPCRTSRTSRATWPGDQIAAGPEDSRREVAGEDRRTTGYKIPDLPGAADGNAG